VVIATRRVPGAETSSAQANRTRPPEPITLAVACSRKDSTRHQIAPRAGPYATSSDTCPLAPHPPGGSSRTDRRSGPLCHARRCPPGHDARAPPLQEALTEYTWLREDLARSPAVADSEWARKPPPDEPWC